MTRTHLGILLSMILYVSAVSASMFATVGQCTISKNQLQELVKISYKKDKALNSFMKERTKDKILTQYEYLEIKSYIAWNDLNQN